MILSRIQNYFFWTILQIETRLPFVGPLTSIRAGNVPAFLFHMPSIVTLRAKGQSKEDVISLVLSQDAISLGPDGDPWCGVTLSAEQA